MCTPRYDVTLGRFMRVAHPLPRRRGNHTFVNALPWMCRAGAPWRGLPECCGKWVTVYRRFDWVIVPDCTVPTRYGKWVTVYRRFDRWSGNSAMERLFTALREERVIGAEIRVPAMDSTSAGAHRHAAGAPKRTPGPSASLPPPGRNMVERVFNRMKRYRKAATRYGRLDGPSSPTSGSSSSPST